MKQPIDLKHFEAAYKRAKSGKLLWVTCKALNEREAGRKMDIHIATNHPKYRRYAGAFLVKLSTLLTNQLNCY